MVMGECEYWKVMLCYVLCVFVSLYPFYQNCCHILYSRSTQKDASVRDAMPGKRRAYVAYLTTFWSVHVAIYFIRTICLKAIPDSQWRTHLRTNSTIFWEYLGQGYIMQMLYHAHYLKSRIHMEIWKSEMRELWLEKREKNGDERIKQERYFPAHYSQEIFNWMGFLSFLQDLKGYVFFAVKLGWAQDDNKVVLLAWWWWRSFLYIIFTFAVLLLGWW